MQTATALVLVVATRWCRREKQSDGAVWGRTGVEGGEGGREKDEGGACAPCPCPCPLPPLPSRGVNKIDVREARRWSSPCSAIDLNHATSVTMPTSVLRIRARKQSTRLAYLLRAKMPTSGTCLSAAVVVDCGSMLIMCGRVYVGLCGSMWVGLCGSMWCFLCIQKDNAKWVW